MPKGEYSKTKESIVPLRGVVRNGTLVSVLDHEGKEIGGLVTSSTDVTGGNRFIESLVRNPDAIIEGGITRNADGAVTSADVVFPDGNTGTYTALVLSSDFPGAVDSYSITYGDQTYTQPTVTRNADGAVIDRPELEVA